MLGALEFDDLLVTSYFLNSLLEPARDTYHLRARLTYDLTHLVLWLYVSKIEQLMKAVHAK